MYLRQWSHLSGFSRCTDAIFDVLSSDAPSEPVIFVVQSQVKSSIRPQQWCQKFYHQKSPSDFGEGKPSTHQIFYVTGWFKEVKWVKNQNLNDVEDRTRQEIHREVRAMLNSVRKLS
jgi:hypothetical protein